MILSQTSGKTMVRGEYVLSNGLVIPNHFTTIGLQQMVQAAFQQKDYTWYMGLCAHVPADSVALADINEPASENGYARQALPLTKTNWPTTGVLNNQVFIQSKVVTFPITAELATEVTRLFLTDGTYVISISSPIIDSPLILDDEYSAEYRLFFR